MNTEIKEVLRKGSMDLTKANTELLELGLTFKEFEIITDKALKSLRKVYVMGRFFDGMTDGEISRESGLGMGVVSKITREYWNEEMQRKSDDKA